MMLNDKVIVVTGGASGIGETLCRRFAAEGARGIVVADRKLRGSPMAVFYRRRRLKIPAFRK